MSEVYHIDAQPVDFEGNGRIGRYVLLPGSDGRAEAISQHLMNVQVKRSDRRLNCYLGCLESLEPGGQAIDVAVVSTGMGCPSTDIVLHELMVLGARRFLRLGTAGSLQHGFVRFGHFVVATGAVRDEGTTRNYAPLEFPAIADADVVQALLKASSQYSELTVHAGIVHCKDSLYAREFGVGPLAEEHRRYMDILSRCGTLASEMESAQLFIRAQIENQTRQSAGGLLDRIKAGALLAIVGDDGPFAKDGKEDVTRQLIALGLEGVRQLHAQDTDPSL